MAGEANGAEFEGAAFGVNYAAARGMTSTGAFVGGIISPEPEKIRPPARIFRFGDAKKAINTDRYGRWWVTWETIELLVQYAVDAESLVRICRRHLAVPEGFNAMDRVFTANAQKTVRAFGGVGGIVMERLPNSMKRRGIKGVWPGGAELTGQPSDRTMKRQLFIPGLWKVPDALAFGPDMNVSEWVSAFHGGRI